MKYLPLILSAVLLSACDYAEVSKTLPTENGIVHLDNGIRDNSDKVIPVDAGVTILADPLTRQEYIVVIYAGHIAITPRLGTPVAAESK